MGGARCGVPDVLVGGGAEGLQLRPDPREKRLAEQGEDGAIVAVQSLAQLLLPRASEMVWDMGREEVGRGHGEREGRGQNTRRGRGWGV